MRYLFLCVAAVCCGDESPRISTTASPSVVGIIDPPSPQIIPKPPVPQKRLAIYKTKYDTKQKARAHNIELVASKLNGAQLMPDVPFSFNERVGPRDELAGFKKAPVIFMGEMDSDFGGGTCQASSTLYAVSLLAGMKIVTRNGHSRPAIYIGKGLDATVAFPNIDLVISNPYSDPITLRAEAKDGELSVWLMGTKTQDVPQVKWRWLGGKLIDYDQRYRKTNTYRNDHKKLKQRGHPGQNGFLVVEHTLGERKWAKRIPSSYKPVDEVWIVGLAWDMEQKPWEPSE